MSEHITFIGVGRMGAPMATRLIEAGHTVSVVDNSDAAITAMVEKGAMASPPLFEVSSPIIVTSLPTPEIVERVAHSLGPVDPEEGRILIDMSTTGARGAQRIAEILETKGITMVDAPVSGGIKGAIKGTLAISASGPEKAFAKAAPVLEIMGKVFYVGPESGQGQTVKLLNNLLSVAAVALSAEVVTMAEKAGLDIAQTLDIINSGSGKNSATADKFPNHVVPRTFDYGFALDLADKDVRLCLEEADAMGVPMIVGSAVRQLMAVSRQKFCPGGDITDVVRVVEGWAGVEVAAKKN